MIRVAVCAHQLKHANRHFARGDVLEMTDADAAAAVADGNVSIAPEDAELSDGVLAAPWGGPARPAADDDSAGAHAVRSAIEAGGGRP